MDAGPLAEEAFPPQAQGPGVVRPELTSLRDLQRGVGREGVVDCLQGNGIVPPGKMYFWIQLKLRRVARKRSWSMVIAWMATRPPGARSRSRAAK